MLRLLKLVIIAVAVALLTGCYNNAVAPGMDLIVNLDITPEGELNTGEPISVCLDMKYAGEQQSFDGVIILEDSVYYGQFGGLPGEVMTSDFSSVLFSSNNGIMEYNACPVGERIVYKGGKGLESVNLLAEVRIRKAEQDVYSSGFCVPVGLNPGECGLKTSVRFPTGSSVKTADIKMVKNADGGMIYVTIPVKESCEVIGKEAVFLKSDTKKSKKRFSGDDVNVMLGQDGGRLDCSVSDVGNNKKEKIIKCSGPINAADRYDEKIEINMEYGCVYEQVKKIIFKKEVENVIGEEDIA